MKRDELERWGLVLGFRLVLPCDLEWGLDKAGTQGSGSYFLCKFWEEWQGGCSANWGNHCSAHWGASKGESSSQGQWRWFNTSWMRLPAVWPVVPLGRAGGLGLCCFTQTVMSWPVGYNFCHYVLSWRGVPLAFLLYNPQAVCHQAATPETRKEHWKPCDTKLATQGKAVRSIAQPLGVLRCSVREHWLAAASKRCEDWLFVFHCVR